MCVKKKTKAGSGCQELRNPVRFTEVIVKRTRSQIRNPAWVSASVSYLVSCAYQVWYMCMYEVVIADSLVATVWMNFKPAIDGQ